MFVDSKHVYSVWDRELKNRYYKAVPAVLVENRSDAKVAIMSAGPFITEYVYEGRNYVRETMLNYTVYVFDNNVLKPAYVLNTGKYGYYAKSNGKISFLNSHEGIPNNYDGGIPYWPEKQRNKVWYKFYDASEFLEKTEERKGNPQAVSTAAAQKLKALVKKMDAEDNPVLVIAKLK